MTAYANRKNVRATNTLTTLIVPASAHPKNAWKTFTSTQEIVNAVALNQQMIFVPQVLLGTAQIATVSVMQTNLCAKMMISTWIRSDAFVSVMKFFVMKVKFGTNPSVRVFAVQESALKTSTGTTRTAIASVCLLTARQEPHGALKHANVSVKNLLATLTLITNIFLTLKRASASATLQLSTAKLARFMTLRNVHAFVSLRIVLTKNFGMKANACVFANPKSALILNTGAQA